MTSPVLSMGQQTYAISVQHVFVANRQRLCETLRHVAQSASIVFLEGGASTTRFDSDCEPIFRQESYFMYLTGVKEPDCSVMIHVESGATTLFIPRLPSEYATIMGRIKTPNEWKDAYAMDAVLYVDEVEKALAAALFPTTNDKSSNTSRIHQRQLLLMRGRNTDSGTMYEPPEALLKHHMLANVVDVDTLFPILAECRVVKSGAEKLLMQHIAELSSFAHAYVMRNMKPGMTEYQGESLFRHYTYFNYGSRLQSYTSICGCGPSGAVLHYGHTGYPNDRQSSSGDICLFDMGAEYFCYASDITCSFPISGKFDKMQSAVYKGVLDAQVAVYSVIKPGVSWVDCHLAAEERIIDALVGIGIVLPGIKSNRELVEMRLGAVFMPHGLGHLIGLDAHDVGGYLPGHPSRSPLPGLKSLRTARVLREDMTLTVEPGCYFIDHLLDEAMADDSPLQTHLNPGKVNVMRGWGGVRLEDVVQVTADGCVNYTLCPRTITEVEHVMKGGKWPPLKDEAPELRRVRLCEPPTPLPSPPSL